MVDLLASSRPSRPCERLRVLPAGGSFKDYSPRSRDQARLTNHGR